MTQNPNSFTILGTSAGVPMANRATTSHVLKVGESLTAIDCGGSFSQRFLQEGFDPLKIDRVIVTHTHPDHVAELPMLIQMLKLLKRTEPVQFFLPEEFVEPFLRYLPSMYLFRENFPFEMKVVGYREGTLIEGECTIRAIANSHLAKYADEGEAKGLANRGQAFSLDIRVGERTLFHSGDIGSYQDVRPHIDNHDYVVIESAHLCLDDLIADAQRLKVGQFVVSHVVSEKAVEQIERKAREAGVSNLIVAKDGERLQL